MAEGATLILTTTTQHPNKAILAHSLSSEAYIWLGAVIITNQSGNYYYPHQISPLDFLQT